MNNLRKNLIVSINNFTTNKNRIDELEQITDDFTIKFVVWLDKNKKELKNEIIIEELQQYFKENVYNK